MPEQSYWWIVNPGENLSRTLRSYVLKASVVESGLIPSIDP